MTNPTVELFTDGGKELSKETCEIAKISNELEIGANRLKKKRGRQGTRLGADGVTRVIACIKNNERNKVWNEIYTKNFHRN